MPSQHVKSISLTPELASWVDEQVASGDFGNTSELFREALRGLKERKERRAAELDAIRASIRQGVAELDRGEGIGGPPREVLGEIRERVKRRRAAS